MPSNGMEMLNAILTFFQNFAVLQLTNTFIKIYNNPEKH